MTHSHKHPVLRQALTFFLVLVPVVAILGLLWSHMAFQTRIVAVMQFTAAQQLGLVPQERPGPFSPERVWVAKAHDGQFELRGAWPLLGSLPFDYFMSGISSTDLLAACDQLGEEKCRRLPG